MWGAVLAASEESELSGEEKRFLLKKGVYRTNPDGTHVGVHVDVVNRSSIHSIMPVKVRVPPPC